MSRIQGLIVVVGLSVLCGVGYLALSTESRRPEQALQSGVRSSSSLTEADNRGSAAVDMLESTVSSLALRIASVEGQLSALQAAIPPATQTAAPASPASVSGGVSGRVVEVDRMLADPVLLADRDRDTWETYLTDLDRDFEYGAVDERWAHEVSVDIELALAGSEPGNLPPDALRVSGIDCRDTLCRVEISSDGDESGSGLDYLLPQMLSEVLPNAAIDRVQMEDGTVSTMIYLARDGYAPPGSEGAY